MSALSVRGVSPEARLRAGGAPGIRQAAGSAARLLAENAAAHDRDGAFPAGGIEAVWAAGLGNLTLPVDLGGVGADLRMATRAISTVATGDASVALVLVMHYVHLTLVLDDAVAPSLRSSVVGSSLAGPALANAIRVERDLGTPSRGGVPATRATRIVDGEGGAAWRLSGRKIFSTGAPGLHWLFVWAATADDDPDGVRIGWFVVPGGAPGVAIEDSWDHLGMRASASHDIVLADVEIPDENAFGLHVPSPDPQDGRDPVAAAGMIALLLAVYRGAAMAGRDWLVRHLNERTPSALGTALATVPRIQAALGEIEARLVTADRLLDGLAADLDAGGEAARSAGVAAPLLKLVVCRELIAAMEAAVGLVGNAGLSRSNPLERHYRDVLCSRVHTPQDDASALAAGRRVLADHPQGA
jgi:alkylation response protein AidB-like acyl-CoA dehydrogenase